MVQYLFDQNIIIYTFAGLCGLGLLVRLIVNLVYKHLVKESDSPGETKNKMVKHLKLKFETCYKLKIGVNNVDTFVDKNVLRYRFCGVLLSTWDNFCGQVLFLTLLLVPICAVFGTVFRCGQDQILLTGSVGILASAILILVDKSINLSSKKKMIRLNLLDYLENFCKVRLEQEVFHPELLEQYRREYLQVSEAGKQISATEVAVKEDPKDELDRRREARQKKEQEKKLQALKREEEQKKIEEARKEEEKRKLEEKRLLAAKRREEELLKMEEEREALEARRLEVKRKAAEKQQANERRQQQSMENDKILHSIKDELEPTEDRTDMDMVLQGLEEIAADKEHALRDKEQVLLDKDLKEQVNIEKPLKERTGKERQQKVTASKSKTQGMSAQEEKLIEDVLKEFFA
jgi:hypothetical protein